MTGSGSSPRPKVSEIRGPSTGTRVRMPKRAREEEDCVLLSATAAVQDAGDTRRLGELIAPEGRKRAQ